MASGNFSARAVIAGGRWQHDLENDHFGSLPDVMVAISSPIGKWPEGTPLHVVLQDLYSRVVTATSANRRVGAFTANAFIDPDFFKIDAILKRSMTGSMTADAVFDLVGTKNFTVDAVLRALGSMTVDAILV